jgi:hypothetical protein
VADEAARESYLAGFHAAQALISERTGRSVKTHNGVKTEFHRLVRSDTRVDDELRGFLGFAYNFKAIADYDTAPGARVTPGAGLAGHRDRQTLRRLDGGTGRGCRTHNGRTHNGMISRDADR